LVPGDTNNAYDVFLRDRTLGTTERLSVSTAGLQAAGSSYFPEISADGRHVAFLSDAANLVAGDNNGTVDVFVRDRVTNTTTRESLGVGGTQIHGDCESVQISGDGSTLAFSTLATDVGFADTNGVPDSFVRNRVTGAVELLAAKSSGGASNGGASGASLSADGRYVAFYSNSSDFFPGKTAQVEDVYVRDRTLQSTSWLSKSLSNGQGDDGSRNPQISADGRYVAFETYATDVLPGPPPIAVQIGRRDRVSGAIYNVSSGMGGAAPDNGSSPARISADGRFVAFVSIATNLVPAPSNNAAHVYLRDCTLNTTVRQSLKANGDTAGPNAAPLALAISSDAAVLVWLDWAPDLVPDDSNSLPDVFVRDPARNYSLLCAAKRNSQGCMPVLSATGDTSLASPAPFTLTATQLINQKLGLYLYGPGCGATPFQGGMLCPLFPIKRLSASNTGGNPAPTDCSGTLSFNLKPVLQSTPALVPGTLIYLQGYYRDGASQPSLTGLTQGLQLQVAP